MFENILNNWFMEIIIVLTVLVSGMYSFYTIRKEKRTPKKVFIFSKFGISIYLLVSIILLLFSFSAIFASRFVADITNNYQDKNMMFAIISFVASVLFGTIYSKKLDLKNLRTMERYRKKKEVFNELIKLMSERLSSDKEPDYEMPFLNIYYGQLLMISPEYQANIIHRKVCEFWNNPRLDLYCATMVLFNDFLELDN